jgi:hypothetical protein
VLSDGLVAGHYDVVGAAAENWASSPWELTPRDGYLYGRGVADNKGPILAMALAASALLERGKLGVDLVMLVEGASSWESGWSASFASRARADGERPLPGEEEAGSRGLSEAIERHRVCQRRLSGSGWGVPDRPACSLLCRLRLEKSTLFWRATRSGLERSDPASSTACEA